MAHRTYNTMWEKAIVDLKEQVCAEDNTIDLPADAAPHGAAPPPTAKETFDHHAILYVRYLQILRTLERCYDGMTHPQKRVHVKRVLDHVIVRVLEIKHHLVRWSPPFPEMEAPGAEQAFPWEYVDLDGALMHLNLPPDALDVPIPRYFKEDSRAAMRHRDNVVKGYMALQLRTDRIDVEEPEAIPSYAETAAEPVAGPAEPAQREERARPGRTQGRLVQQMHGDTPRRRIAAAKAAARAAGAAATCIQRMFRGFAARRLAEAERQRELVFIGMRAPAPRDDRTGAELRAAYEKRKLAQAEHADEYARALGEMAERVREEEGPEMRERLREERTAWITARIEGQDGREPAFPEGLEAFYAERKAPPDEDAVAKEDGGKKKGKGSAGRKDPRKGRKGREVRGKDRGADKKGLAGKGKGEPKAAERPPPLQCKREATDRMIECVREYEAMWRGLDESGNPEQRHDARLTREKVRPGVLEEVREEVDRLLLLNLQKIKKQLEAGRKGRKGRKGKKGKKGTKGSKGKAKKAKKGKKAAKKGDKKKKKKKKKKKATTSATDKKKRGKKLPGDKLFKGVDDDQLLGILINDQLLNTYQPIRVADFHGDFYGDARGAAGTRAGGQGAGIGAGAGDGGAFVPQNPRMPQIRSLVTEYAVLPLGSASIKAALDPALNVRSLLFYGPEGSGKTMMAQAVAHELGALFINISPKRIAGLYAGDKKGGTRIVHMAMKVATNPSLAPVVIYIDEAELVFGGGRKAAKDGPSRMKKDLQKYLGDCIQADSRVVVIGCTSRPPAGRDAKDLNRFFDKFVHFPYPDYASRLLLWRHFVLQRLGAAGAGDARAREVPSSLELSALAQISEGYTAGSIRRAVYGTLDEQRLRRLQHRPLTEADFLTALSAQPVATPAEVAELNAYTAEVTGLGARLARLAKIRAGEDPDDGAGSKRKPARK